MREVLPMFEFDQNQGVLELAYDLSELQRKPNALLTPR